MALLPIVYRILALAAPISALVAGMLAAAVVHAQQPAQQNRSVIELMNQIETLNAEINRLRGQIEVLSNSLDNAQRRQRDMYLDLDTRVRRIEGGGEASQKSASELDARVRKLEQQIADLDARPKRTEPAAGAPAPAPAPVPATSTAAIPEPTPPVPPSVPRPSTPAGTETVSPGRAYNDALALYQAGDFQGAIGAFEGFVKRYPRDALAANAQYWVGEAWYNLRDFRAAAASQQTLISTWPDSPKVPDSMLNLSTSQMALGDNAAAKKTMEEVVSRFPKTDAAEKARQRLARMK
jgi:tol-pal system protein YbgF